jgi:hypothetical protein
MSCNICCEVFTLRNRLKVNCGYCDLEACRACVQKCARVPGKNQLAAVDTSLKKNRYLVSTVEDPHCMQCKNAWNREFVDQVQWKPLETVVSDFFEMLLQRRRAQKPSGTTN